MKKKAIKIATASAIAASGFVAVAPTQSEAAPNVKAEVSRAKTVMYNAMYAYSKPFVATGEMVDQAVVYAAYKKGEAQYKYAVSVVNKYAPAKEKAALLADLDKVRKNYLLGRALNYIKAFNALELHVEKAAKELEAALATNDEAKIKEAKANLEKVYEAQKADLNKVVESSIKAHVNELAATVVETAKAAAEKKLEEIAVPKVVEVSAINAKTLEIKFNKAVDKSSVIADGTGGDTSGTLKNGVIELTALDSAAAIANEDNATATLSEDGKTLTVQLETTEIFSGKYGVVVKNVLTDKGASFEKFTSTINFTDSTAPVVTGVQQVDNDTVRVLFSEPVSSFGTVSFQYADGSAVPTLNGATVTALGVGAVQNYMEVELGSAITDNKDIRVNIIGATDFAGNIVNPNPATATIKKLSADGVKPTVQTVTVLSNKAVELKLSEEVKSGFTVTIGGNATTLQQDATDKTKYVATISGATTVSGLQTVAVTGLVDKTGTLGDNFSQVINFAADSVKPVVQSSAIQKINGKEYLVLTFSEKVSLPATFNHTVSVEKLSNYITTNYSLTLTQTNTTLHNPTGGSSTQVKVDVSGFLTGAGVDTTGATYSFNTPVGLAIDGFGNGSEAKAVSFVRGSDTASPTAKPDLDENFDESAAGANDGNGVKIVNNNTIQIKFEAAVDGASATNKLNYFVQGATVDKAKLIAADTVELVLAANSNQFTGLRNITISGVKSSVGTLMDPVTVQETLTENVVPTFTAQLVDPQVIKLTFSENVADMTDAIDLSDLDVYYNGSKLAESGTPQVLGVYEDLAGTIAAATDKGYTTLYVKLASGVITDLTKTLEVVPESTTLVDVTKSGAVVNADVIGNAWSSAKVTVKTN